MTELAETRLRRLRLRSMRRGIKEMDLILSAFAERCLADLAAPEVVLYDELLSENDLDILSWVIGQDQPPAHYVPLLAKVRQVAGHLTDGIADRDIIARSSND